MNKVREAIEEYWGERCQDFDEDCPCCQAWQEYDELVEKAENTCTCEGYYI